MFGYLPERKKMRAKKREKIIREKKTERRKNERNIEKIKDKIKYANTHRYGHTETALRQKKI